MRIRQLRPEFWSDPILGEMPDGERLFYIGLWNIADDGGWFEWQPAQIGALLYPYRTATRRRRDIETWGNALAEARRLVLHDCGCGQIPTLAKHQRITGKQSFQYRDKHRLHIGKQSPLSDSPVTERNVTLGNGRDVSETTLREKMPTLLPEIVGKSA